MRALAKFRFTYGFLGGLVGILLVLIPFCGYVQANISAGSMFETHCSQSPLLVNYSAPRDGSFLYAALLFWFVVWMYIRRLPAARVTMPSSSAFLRIIWFSYSVYHPILWALSRGIIHKQVYEPAIIQG